MSSACPYIYKIVTRDEWSLAIQDHVFRGSPIDLQDGFLHCSTAEQVASTAALYFAKQSDLLLVAIEKTIPNLKWESSRNGELFPHIYGALDPQKNVVWVQEMKLDESGQHILPDLNATD
jgi:uncharacterized protein (DUF952 family)